MIRIKITKIETQKRNLDRVNIYIDDSFAFGLDDEIRYKYGLKSNMEITQEFIDDILIDEEKNKVINFTLNYLSYRQRSEREIEDHLRRKDYEDDLIQLAIDYCKDKGYIDDKAFAESYVRDRVNINKHGSYRIKYDLRNKGISQNIIDQVVDLDSDDEYERALKLAEKKLPSYRKDDRNAKYRKLGGYLQRRGFPFPVVSKVLREVLDE